MNPRALPLLLPLLTACAVEVAPTPADPLVGALTAENFLARYAAARCASEFACHDARSVSLRRYFATEADCVTESLTQENQPDVDELVALSRGPTVRFDAATAQRCLDETARTCPDATFDVAECARVFRGALPLGGACWRGEECGGDAWCDHARTTEGVSTCPGTCRPRAALGDACGQAPCSDARTTGRPYCFGASEGRCVDLQSGPAAGEGQPCGMRELSPTLVTRTRCRDGLACMTTEAGAPRPAQDDGEGTCVRLPRVGEACEPFAPGCGDDAECLGGVCQRAVVVTRVGDPCDRDGAGPRFCSSVRYLTCVDGACQRLGDGGPGSRCTRFCQRGLACQDGACRPLRAADEACRFNDECASGSCDDPAPFDEVPGRCRARYCAR